MEEQRRRAEETRKELFSTKNLRAQLETDIGVETQPEHYFGEPRARCEIEQRKARIEQRKERKRALSAATAPIQAFPLITQWPERFPERSPNRHGLEPRKINLLKGAVKRPRVPFPLEVGPEVKYATTRFYDRADQGLVSAGDAKIRARAGAHIGKVVRNPVGARGEYVLKSGGAEEAGDTQGAKSAKNGKNS